MRDREARCEETNEPTYCAQGAGFVGRSSRGDWSKRSQHPARRDRLQNVIGLGDKELSYDWTTSLSVSATRHCISYLEYN